MKHSSFPPVPAWVPLPAQRYLLHTAAARPIRSLARAAGCHPSTVLRQIRRVEMRRDDPLVDAALAALARAHFPAAPERAGRRPEPEQEPAAMQDPAPSSDPETFEQQAETVLRRLAEPGAVLAVAERMDKAVVVRGDAEGAGTRTAVADAALAQALALNEWIFCDAPGRVSRYRITGAGRAALREMLAARENRAREEREFGFAEDMSPYGVGAATAAGTGQERRDRFFRTESPLILLARRKDRDGRPFLDEALVRAGERLREDFELAQVGPRVCQNWESFLAGGAGDGGCATAPHGPGAARDRVARALSELGPGLSDVVLRCCCYLEGLEQAEKRLGWSARSGKIVLRIALQRLKAHYDQMSGRDALIG